MALSLLLAAVSLPLLPAEAVLLLTLAAGLALVLTLGPMEAPPAEEVTTAAVFAIHGYV
jgi:hypothetical protein